MYLSPVLLASSPRLYGRLTVDIDHKLVRCQIRDLWRNGRHSSYRPSSFVLRVYVRVSLIYVLSISALLPISKANKL